MHKLIVCRGIPASGKSTWAKSWVKEDPTHRVRFNWDDIRNMMGVYWIPEREDTNILSLLRETFLNKFMALEWDIVVDNMNLNPKDLVYYYKISDEYNYTVEIKDFFTPLEECIKRDSYRDNPIGEKVIRNIWKKYGSDIISRYTKQMLSNTYYKEGLPKCIIVDIDGTLCFNTSGRPFYGPGCAEGISLDIPCQTTIDLVNNWKLNNPNGSMFIITGRDYSVHSETYDWLIEHNINFTRIFMRDEGDYDKGDVCKQKIFDREIRNKFNVDFVLDDSQKCVDMYRRNGLLVLQPNEGNF